MLQTPVPIKAPSFDLAGVSRVVNQLPITLELLSQILATFLATGSGVLQLKWEGKGILHFFCQSRRNQKLGWVGRKVPK